MKLNTNSNVYTIVYAAVMVIIVAFLLAFVSSALKSTQDANVANDTKGQILSALRIDKNTVDVQAAFAEKVKDMLWKDGELVPYEGEFKTVYGQAIKDGELHVFVANTDDGVKYVVPVTGRGLWGGLWGYIALNEDKQTVYGTYFYHESETAGLGARIGETDFQNQFQGKQLFAEGVDGVALTVVKSGAVKDEAYEVDGITGATLTSKGVADMLSKGLGQYMSFIGGAAQETCCRAKAECCEAMSECCKADSACCEAKEECCEAKAACCEAKAACCEAKEDCCKAKAACCEAKDDCKACPNVEQKK